MLNMGVGDIWLYDTSSLYGETTSFSIQHWFITSVETYENYGFGSHSYLVKYLHMETGIAKDKVFQYATDLSGSKFYKKVA